MPESHLIPRGDLGLITEDLPFTQVIAANLHPGVTLVPAEFEPQDEIRRLLLAPDQPVLFLGLACAPNLAIPNLPHTGLTIPTLEILAIEDRSKSFFIRTKECRRQN